MGGIYSLKKQDSPSQVSYDEFRRPGNATRLSSPSLPMLAFALSSFLARLCQRDGKDGAWLPLVLVSIWLQTPEKGALFILTIRQTYHQQPRLNDLPILELITVCKGVKDP